MDNPRYMQMALDLAARGAGFTAPNPMVGAVLVAPDGQVVGRGWHRALGSAHAEVEAIADAGDQTRGTTMYVTLEPCNHTGRTPPCSQAVIDAGIRRVVVAMDDPNPDVAGGGTKRLRAHGIEVATGLLADQALRLNEAFVKFVRTRRPLVTLKWAATLDGRIATRSGHSRWVTGPEARREVHRLRNALDAILVGIGTVRADDPQLTVRLEGQPVRDPVRVVLDTHLSIPPEARLLRLDSPAETLIICSDQISAKRRMAVARDGVRVVPAPLKDGRIDLNGLMDRLGAMGIGSLLIEGGGQVAAAALAAGVVDKVMLFYAPKIMGGDDGVPVCRGAGPETMDGCIDVSDIRVESFGDDLLLEGYIR